MVVERQGVKWKYAITCCFDSNFPEIGLVRPVRGASEDFDPRQKMVEMVRPVRGASEW